MNSCAPEGFAVPAALVAPVVNVFWNYDLKSLNFKFVDWIASKMTKGAFISKHRLSYNIYGVNLHLGLNETIGAHIRIGLVAYW